MNYIFNEFYKIFILTQNEPTECTSKFKTNEDSKRTEPSDMSATATYEIDTEFDRDIQAVFERDKIINDELKNKAEDDKVYIGINNYQQIIKKKDSVLGNPSSGLARNTGNIIDLNKIRLTPIDYGVNIDISKHPIFENESSIQKINEKDQISEKLFLHQKDPNYLSIPIQVSKINFNQRYYDYITLKILKSVYIVH